MSLLPRQAATLRLGASRLLLPTGPHTRAASFRRLHALLNHVKARQSNSDFYSLTPLTFDTFSPRLHHPSPTLSRAFSHARYVRQQTQQQRSEDVKDPFPEGGQQKAEQQKAEQETTGSQSSSGEPEGDQTKEQNQRRKEEEPGDKEEQKDKKKDAPPPPPHGDKSPWQVFTETLQSEFKASKEWNESTKALGSSVNQFTESESVKRARQLYEQTSGAASTRVSSAVKTTGRAIGSGAAWTWDTPVMKGVRKGATTVGKGVDKATKPIRETQAYKNVKDVIDDGSSSRYGGWVEKEERRKAREVRELKEARAGMRKAEKMEEDPK
jgi:hypothetical protein